MKVTMMLCDAAQASEGKLNILGGGWSVTGPKPQQSAIALIVQVPWDQANSRHEFTLELMDADGQPVIVPNEDGEGPLRIEGTFETGRPAGVRPGTPLDVVAALTIPPQPIPPGARYTWQLEINGSTHEDWRLPFTVRPESD